MVLVLDKLASELGSGTLGAWGAGTHGSFCGRHSRGPVRPPQVRV